MTIEMLTKDERSTIRSMALYWNEVAHRPECRDIFKSELSSIVTMFGPRILFALEDYVEKLDKVERLNRELKIAVTYLKVGKDKFTPNTTNSFVDDFINKHRGLISEDQC